MVALSLNSREARLDTLTEILHYNITIVILLLFKFVNGAGQSYVIPL